jgi:hypothetical protein
MICQLCGQKKKLIKAHIIPEGFFRPLRSGRKAPELHTNSKGVYPQRVPIGIYDKEILCADCDGKFSLWENHAHKVLIQNFTEDLAIYWNGQRICYNIIDFDYKLFKLFFLSLLWRASISNHIFYHRISVGPFEQKLKDMILANDPGPPQTFAVTLAKFSDPNITVIMDPHLEKFSGINYCRFYLTGFVAYIKVDDRPVPDFMRDFYLRPDTPLPIILRDFHRSKDGALMKDIFQKSLLKMDI